MSQKIKTAAIKNESKLYSDSVSDLENFFRVSKPTKLETSVETQTLELLQLRQKQLEEMFVDNSELEVTWDKTVEETILFGLRANDSFRAYLTRKRNSNPAPKKKLGQNNSRSTNKSSSDDDDSNKNLLSLEGSN